MAPNHGGGLYALNSDVILRDCLIEGNEANIGGGLAFQGPSRPRLERCTIRDNRCLGPGGGLLSEEDALLTAIDCDLLDNVGGMGGGAGTGSGGLFLRDCRLTGNTADFGGGIGLISADSVRIIACTVAGNSAGLWGGGLCADAAPFTLIGGRIEGNSSAGDGGAAYLLGSEGHIEGCAIRDNAAASTAGGIYLDKSLLTVTGGSLTGNGLAIQVAEPPAGTVDARSNWWGDDSGPYHPVENPGGQGDAVSDHVLFSPWIVATSAPAAAAAGLRLEAGSALGAIRLRLALPAAGLARLSVYDVAGRRMAILLDGFQSAGLHSLVWDGRDARGRPAGAGIYLFRLESGGRAAAARGLLIH